MNGHEAVHRLVVSADLKGSGSLGQQARLRARRGMYEVFEAAFDAVGASGNLLHLEDRGDGVLAALAPQVPPSLLVGIWLEEVYQGLREHNAGERDPLRLRIAMHGGPVSHDGRGLVGRAVDLTCRLCDSEPARAVLDADDGIDLVFVVSDSLYHSVVADGGRFVEPEHYRPHRVRSKETDETAWFHVPRRSRPPLPEPEQAEAPQGPGRRDVPAAAGRPGADSGPQRPTKYSITVNGGTNQVVDGAEVHGDINGVRVTREDDSVDGGERA
ncbi:hypothetical protein [Streptomyces sp. NBC_01618]|uniref:hypothetical protein n=1 Tax=Streptomyces sp. NBC_01618 TaxID=2975900 RepID=UPI00386D0B2F|nr:hypothetical protein OH735_31575 [Streptomyces sp. NBC_01618]